MTASGITPFLSDHAQVALALRHDADFQAFFAVAQKSSGELPQEADLSTVRFRLADRVQGLPDELQFADTIMVGQKAVTIANLLAPSLTIDRTQLIHSLWRLESFTEVKAWLQAMGALVRFARDLEGKLRGHIQLAASIIPMVETVERREYVLPNGDMASDAITRNYGIRAKVFALDRLRRSPRSSDYNSIMDRLSRTLSSKSKS